MKKAVPVLKGIPDEQIRISYKDVRGGSRISKGGLDGRPYLLAGGSRISSGELDDADDVEGFSLRVLKKGVCIDHF